MGPQSQRRLTLKERTHQLAGNNRRKERGGQLTLTGERAFDPIVDCKPCKQFHWLGTKSHKRHHELCTRVKRKRNVGITPAQQKKMEKELRDSYRAKHLTQENVDRLFDTATYRKAAPAAPAMVTEIPTEKRSARPSSNVLTKESPSTSTPEALFDGISLKVNDSYCSCPIATSSKSTSATNTNATTVVLSTTTSASIDAVAFCCAC